MKHVPCRLELEEELAAQSPHDANFASRGVPRL